MGVYNKSGASLIPNQIFVTDFGAKGDGTTNDSAALQAALDAANSGGIVYFPVGVYKLETAICFYSNQRLIFEPGATILQGAAINNLMRSYCEAEWTGYDGTHDVEIIGATFKNTSFTTSTTMLGFVHCKNIVIDHCKFVGSKAGWHYLEINSSRNVRITNCVFDATDKTSGEMLQIDSDDSATVWPWDGASHDGIGSENVLISGCVFQAGTNSPAIGNHHGDDYNNIIISGNVFQGCTHEDGAIAFKTGSECVNIYGNMFDGCTYGARYTETTTFVHGNVFASVTTAMTGNGVLKNNIINGTYTA